MGKAWNAITYYISECLLTLKTATINWEGNINKQGGGGQSMLPLAFADPTDISSNQLPRG